MRYRNIATVHRLHTFFVHNGVPSWHHVQFESSLRNSLQASGV